MKEARRLKPGEKAFGYLMLALSLFLFYHAYEISGFSSISSAGGWPMFAAFVMIVCSVIVILRNLRQEPVEIDSRLHELRRFVREIFPPHPLVAYVFIIVAYMLAIEPLGFNISSFLFLLFSFLYLYRRGFWLTLALSLGAVVIIYVTFELVFRVILPQAEWLDLSVIGLGG